MLCRSLVGVMVCIGHMARPTLSQGASTDVGFCQHLWGALELVNDCCFAFTY